ncbi:MAG: hypothetical protein EP297_08150, partial [Gammaproteobacteria bacterium]
MNWRSVNIIVALLFWGWWADFMLPAIVFAVVIVIAPRLTFRLKLDDRHFNHIVDLTSVVVAVIGLYLIFNSGRHGIFTLLAWMPVLLFPLFASQHYSTAGSISLSSLVLAMRSQQKTINAGQVNRVDIAWSYMALCVLAASVQVIDHSWFFPMLLLLVSMALFASRPSRYHWAVWFIVLAVGGGLGYAGQIGLRTLHHHIEEVSLALLDAWLSKDRDISHT